MLRAAVLLISASFVTLSGCREEEPDRGAYPRLMNPKRPDGQVLYMGGGEGCHWVAAGVSVDRLTDAINKTEPASCDPLLSPVWKECPFGGIYANLDATTCVCRLSGRPPQPLGSCPK
jgi:hypothetical protein